MPNYKHKEKRREPQNNYFFIFKKKKRNLAWAQSFISCALFSHPSGLEFDPRKVECDLLVPLWSKPMSSSLLLPTLFALDKHANPPTYCCSNCLKVIYSHQSSRISRVVNFIFITKSGLKKSIRFILFEFSMKPNF